jgi:type IV pilus assembly protein PilX
MFANPVENNRFRTPPPGRQEGVILVVGMILLIMITLYALASIRGIAGQEHIAGNLYDREIAFTAAETILRHAERLVTDTVDSGLNLTSLPTSGDEGFKSASFTELQTLIPNKVDSLRPPEVPVDHAPRYAIHRMANSAICEGGDQTYKITAMGIGRNPDSIVVLQSIVCR